MGRSSSSGDGWAFCRQGHRHWGRFGAAGLLLVRDDPVHNNEVLLQLRAAHTQHGDTWSVPGGACDSDESPVHGALREAREEIGLKAVDVQIFDEFIDDHGGWRYTTVLARPVGALALRHNHESTAVRWVPTSEVTKLALHHGFRASWPAVHRLLTPAVDA